jgi:hypothetical protein
MYETHKARALTLMHKKGMKFAEINAIINDELIPKIEKLKLESEEYFQWRS